MTLLADCAFQTSKTTLSWLMLLPIDEINNRSAGRCSDLFGKKQGNMTHIADNQIARLREVPQPPLSYPGATHEADRTKRPPLGQPWRWADDARRGLLHTR